MLDEAIVKPGRTLPPIGMAPLLPELLEQLDCAPPELAEKLNSILCPPGPIVTPSLKPLFPGKAEALP